MKETDRRPSRPRGKKKHDRGPRTTKLKKGQKTWTGLVEAFRKDIKLQMSELEKHGSYTDEDVDPEYLLIIGWGLAKGMNAKESIDFADHVWNEEDII